MRQEDHPVLRAIQEIKKAVIGKDDCIVKVMTAILAGGHILIEDIPGGRENYDGACFFQSFKFGTAQDSVYAGCASGGCDGIFSLSERSQSICISAGSSYV